MSDTPSRPRQTRAQRTAEGILMAATGLFATHEPQRVTVDQIAIAADVAVGSIYVHYGSKERLYLAVVERALEVCLSYTGRRPWSASPVERMKRMGEAFVEFAIAHPDEFRIVGERATERTGIAEYSDLEDHIQELVQRDIFQLAADAHAAIEAGEIRDMPIQQVVSYFWALWSGMIAMTTRADMFRITPEQLRPMLADAAEVLERGLAPSSPAAHREGGRYAA
ncbi:MAG: TetR family transcriptional regulator [Solirubrobacteraceae bacterium]|nr:TetR family transcriptional regulator [Solirubrobacteraceae bacterium]